MAGTEHDADSEPTPAPGLSVFAPGDVVDGRYRVLRLIARGGMGEVYEVDDTLVGVHVALKALRAPLADDDRAGERMRREAQLARRITHPNVCRLFDFGLHGRRVPFLTMELLAGETLAERLARGPLPPAEALAAAAGIAAALDAAHAAGVLHRDLKPGNVIVVGDRPVVTDFGLARAGDGGEGPRVTRDGGFVGTPAYMAPEQVEGRELSPRTDVYAFGVLLYELVTGSLPFEGDTPLAVAARRLRQPPPPPSARAPGLDGRWDAVVARCLALEPAGRFATAGAAVAALRRGPRGRWRPFVLPALVAAVAAVVARPLPASPELASPAAPAVRRVLGVVAVPASADARIVADALRLSLAGDRLRVHLGRRSDEVVADLALTPDSLAHRDKRVALAGALSVDDVALVTPSAGGGVRVTLFDAGGAELLAVDSGPAPRQASAAASAIAAKLGVDAPAALPASEAALRSYSEGLLAAAQRRYEDARAAHARAALESPDSAALLADLAAAQQTAGDGAGALASLVRARELLGAGRAEPRLAVLASLLEMTDQRSAAIAVLHGLLALYPDSLEEAVRLARMESRAGRPHDAQRTLARAAAVLRPREDPELDRMTLRIYIDLGDARAAHDLASRLADGARAIGRNIVLADALRYQAYSEADIGDYDTALAFADEAGAACARSPAPERCDVPVLAVRAELLLEGGAIARAGADLGRIGPRITGDWSKFNAQILLLVARHAIAEGDLDRAGRELEGALNETGSVFSTEAEGVRGQILVERDDLTAALGACEQAVAAARRSGDQSLLARQLLVLADIAVRGGHLSEARAHAEEALAIGGALGYTRLRGRARVVLAAAELASGHPDAAATAAAAARDELARVHARDDEAEATIVLSRALAAAGRAEDARAAASALAARGIETFTLRMRLRALAGAPPRPLADEARKRGFLALARELPCLADPGATGCAR